jgi:hypothetical protein
MNQFTVFCMQSAGFVTARALKITVCAIFFISRIDTPFMAPGVGVVGRKCLTTDRTIQMCLANLSLNFCACLRARELSH